MFQRFDTHLTYRCVTQISSDFLTNISKETSPITACSIFLFVRLT